MWDTLKLIITTFIGILISYLQPIYNPVKVLAIIFIIDIATGILVDIIKNDDRIRIKKLLIAVAFLALYTLIIACTYIIGEHMGDTEEALIIVKVLTYIFTYFYASNTLRNIRQLAPDNKPIAFLDYWLGLQIVKRLPDLADYLGLSNTKNSNKNETDK
ncbi:hypothetical protein D0T53_12830 [Dysgonomonas sp. 216]|uniref:phage holin family protein n=1 Tax=Dysgonomonas sp. 216 TaxID=2302934 RepID=UPI0013D5EE54|nr:phage holin family protein [Dysgonomonas sp. 216]NDW19784.1 hypothetical protein [Dysgonomonas sp. 216]